MLKVKIKFLGILNDYIDEITLDVKQNSSIIEIRNQIIEHIVKSNLKHLKETVERSIFSDEKEILNETVYIISKDCTIYLLPPFSGG